MLTLGEILRATHSSLEGGRPSNLDVTFTKTVVDSRQVAPGALFVALRGQSHDGHSFVAQAFAAGAAAVLVDHVPAECLGDPASEADRPLLIVVPSTQKALEAMAAHALKLHDHLDVVGITGSLGKTTTKEIVAGTLARWHHVLKTEGNLNSEIGLPLTVLNGLRPEHRVAVLEMGMYDVGDIRLLARLAQPRVGVVTAVQPDHLERLGTIERIQAAKQELVEELPSNGVAVLNADDPRVVAMRSATRARTVLYGLTVEADVRARNVASRGLDGVDFDLELDGQSDHVHLALLGAQTVPAALAAAAVAREQGLRFAEIVDALQALAPALRLKVVEGINGSRVVDDSYNASPESMLAALRLLGELPGSRKIAILGDMLELGSAEADGHRRVGSQAAQVADLVIGVGERSRLMTQAARATGLPADQVLDASGGEEVIALLRQTLRPGDDVLVKGSRAMGLDAVADAIRASAVG
jgi:UDP-N-acetylmuramoyl-tripeptide--D-alanyl-D-alanine ligase